jgi:hypothetical protein
VEGCRDHAYEVLELKGLVERLCLGLDTAFIFGWRAPLCFGDEYVKLVDGKSKDNLEEDEVIGDEKSEI